ncbi:hypothetical protein SAMN05216188_101661 [Lentzea xinjiangensis]|uniref:Uncharacterized protein n=1 Tax=Lentzea xinjiangensis TaxID=402600 RepID=A0A1H9B684_9PSEU|nr:hypothetical protein [Lentzea xinjiangensis]SEP84365.1 hypothetical protein SAMN05216188_101661 [Lentzea xinjiangensis]
MTAWRTPDVLAAEDFLTGAVAEVDRAMRSARQELRGKEPSTEDIRRVMQFAKSGDASPAMRRLADRIARGAGLSWRQVLTGEASHDPLVRQALEADRARLEELIQGETAPPPPPRRPARTDDDEPLTFTEDAW